LTATLTGIGSDRKPSTRSLPSTFQGAKANGSATLARIASTTLPDERSTSSPFEKSVAVM